MAWQFTAAESDYVTLDDAAALHLPDAPWTLAGWFRHSSPASATWHSLVGWQNAATNTLRLLASGANVAGYNGRLLCRIYDAAGNTPGLLTTAGAYADTAWHHVALLRDAAGALWCYVDGAADPAVGMKAQIWGAVAPAAPLHFGRDANAVNYADANLAEWAKWDRALTAGEIAALADGQPPEALYRGIAWYVRMLPARYTDDAAALTVTNHGTTTADHPAAVAVHIPPQYVEPSPTDHSFIDGTTAGSAARQIALIEGIDAGTLDGTTWPLGPADWDARLAALLAAAPAAVDPRPDLGLVETPSMYWNAYACGHYQADRWDFIRTRGDADIWRVIQGTTFQPGGFSYYAADYNVALSLLRANAFQVGQVARWLIDESTPESPEVRGTVARAHTGAAPIGGTDRLNVMSGDVNLALILSLARDTAALVAAHPTLINLVWDSEYQTAAIAGDTTDAVCGHFDLDPAYVVGHGIADAADPANHLPEAQFAADYTRDATVAHQWAAALVLAAFPWLTIDTDPRYSRRQYVGDRVQRWSMMPQHDASRTIAQHRLAQADGATVVDNGPHLITDAAAPTLAQYRAMRAAIRALGGQATNYWINHAALDWAAVLAGTHDLWEAAAAARAADNNRPAFDADPSTAAVCLLHLTEDDAALHAPAGVALAKSADNAWWHYTIAWKNTAAALSRLGLHWRMVRSDDAEFTADGLAHAFRAIVAPSAAVATPATLATLAAYAAAGGRLITHPASPLLALPGAAALAGDYTAGAGWSPAWSLCPPFDNVLTISRDAFEAFLAALAADLAGKIGATSIDPAGRLLAIAGRTSAHHPDPGRPALCLINAGDDVVAWTNPLDGALNDLEGPDRLAAAATLVIEPGAAVYLYQAAADGETLALQLHGRRSYWAAAQSTWAPGAQAAATWAPGAQAAATWAPGAQAAEVRP